MWHLGLYPGSDGRLFVEKVALLSGHEGEVWQMEWDMSGMTLATTGSDGVVRLWQSNLNGCGTNKLLLKPDTPSPLRSVTLSDSNPHLLFTI
ncbi:hypothetical protein MKX03_036686 [Papaver bracteatum]|nr:hypothetical protein MKX03_036686 [Papaver bracteatum]